MRLGSVHGVRHICIPQSGAIKPLLSEIILRNTVCTADCNVYSFLFINLVEFSNGCISPNKEGTKCVVYVLYSFLFFSQAKCTLLSWCIMKIVPPICTSAVLHEYNICFY